MEFNSLKRMLESELLKPPLALSIKGVVIPVFVHNHQIQYVLPLEIIGLRAKMPNRDTELD